MTAATTETEHPPAFPLAFAVLIWLGQCVSLLGSGLTSFALGVWMYETTGGVTRFALVMLSATLPAILLGPVAGALVDRWNRRWVLIVSDSVAGLMSLVLATLLFSGNLQPWHAYVTTAVVSAASSFQQPAFGVLVSTVIPPQHLGRANGMVQLGLAASQLIAPLASASLMATIHLQGILIIDAVTFILGTTPLLLLRIPKRFLTTPVQEERPSLGESVRAGARYLGTSPGLLVLIGLLATSNFFVGVVEVLVTPLVLSLSNVGALAAITTAGGVGLLAGSLAMSALGSPRRMVHGILAVQFISGVLFILVGCVTSIPLLTGIAFCFFFSIPLVNGASQTLLQRKVPLELRGRVFAFTGTLTGAMLPLAYTLSGPLADQVFEPALRPGGALAALLGRFVGEGAGRGIAVMFILAGLLTMFVTALAALSRPLRGLDGPDAAPASDVASSP
ncbi:MFS transporter [Corallococcus terminator]|uniref:MFS transporter n=1 Tax=Corallococcus terminator TaxID=2316733 RepID=A0A3A8JT15_9BACT|nr:MFS transporter [Corallococcus terminator]RKG93571.1 MFS transporter [Corallococcus terminator]